MSVAILLCCCYTSFAQEVKVTGKFHRDSVRIGEEVPFSLSVRYPANIDIVLPDSAYAFAPFEFSRKVYYPTVTKSNISYDSVVYFLMTYEIDPVQTLRLPAFVIHARDCTAMESNTDTVLLNQMVREKYDSLDVKALPLKTNTDYLTVSWLFNYPVVLIAGGILIVTLAVLWIIFGKRILRHYRLKRMTRRHQAFLHQYSAAVRNLREHFSTDAAESIFVLWKKYMEGLLSRPYTRYTAREIIRVENNESLGTALRALNRVIYAGVNAASEEAFGQLQAYTEEQFSKKTREIKHG